MEFQKKPTALIILDGFGYQKEKEYNAIAHAHTPNYHAWLVEYPHAFIKASGNAVGLPEGFMGNSQVGHLTIGAGRIIMQPIVLMDELIQKRELANNTKLIESLEQLSKSQRSLHIIGLLSDGGIHSHIDHLFAFIDIAVKYKIHALYIHAILDGRDVPPHSAEKYLTQLEKHCKPYKNIHIASLCGRFYAMDRDKHWERTEQYYRILTNPITIQPQDWRLILQYYYKQGLDDQHIPCVQLVAQGIIQQHDGIIFFNIRPDRARQLTQAFVYPQFNSFPCHHIHLAFFITPVSYGEEYPTIALIKMPAITHTLKEILSANNKSIFSIAETEKYAHVTYFFDGRRETIFPNETRILIPSIVTDSFAQFPEMSAPLITDRILQSLRTLPQDFYLINYANADMVGHSGDFNATVHAVECLDEQLGALYEQIVLRMNGTMYITADHGKAENLYNPYNHQPHTAHTTNPVPFLFLSRALKNSKVSLPVTQLGDIAPFILKELKLPIPDIMHQLD